MGPVVVKCRQAFHRDPQASRKAALLLRRKQAALLRRCRWVAQRERIRALRSSARAPKEKKETDNAPELQTLDLVRACARMLYAQNVQLGHKGL